MTRRSAERGRGRAPSRRAAALGAIGAVAALSGCAEIGVRAPAAGPQITQAAAADAIEPGPTALIDARLQPVPEEFEIADTAVWDGERTLQGIWVAHPAAETARRVRILNTDTGYAVDGALFRRDDAAGGAAVLVSSDAAAALGMEPDKAVTLSIVAIKRGPVRPSDLAAAAGPAPEEEQAAPAEEETVAAQPAAVAEAEAETPEAEAEAAPEVPEEEPVVAAVEPEAAAPGEREIEARTEAAFVAAEAAGPDAEAPPETAPDTGFVEDWPLSREAPGGEAAREAGRAVQPAAGERPEPEVAEAEPAREAAPAPEPAAAPEPEPAPAPETAEPETAEPETTEPETVEAAPETVELARAEPAEAAAPERADASLDRPFIQAGIFGVEANAARLIETIREAGFPAEGRPGTYGERVLTRVLAGPFESAEERDRALRRIRGFGVPDALPVAR